MKSRTFNRLFVRRVWAGMLVGLVWMADRLMEQHWTGAVIAFAVGFIFSPAIAYVWTRNSLKELRQ